MKISDMRNSYTKAFGDIPVTYVFHYDKQNEFYMKTSCIDILYNGYGAEEINAIDLKNGTHKYFKSDTEVTFLHTELFIT